MHRRSPVCRPSRRRSSSFTVTATRSSPWGRRAASSNGCVACRPNRSYYVELPGAGHGFDLTDGTRTGAAVRAIGLFLNHIHHSRQRAESMRSEEKRQSAAANSSSNAACMQSA